MEENKNQNQSDNENWNKEETPQWVRDMKAWHEEDPNRRHAMAAYSDENTNGTALIGASLPIILALAYGGDPVETITKMTVDAKKDPMLRLRLMCEYAKFRKENGYPDTEEKSEDDSKDSGIRSALKDILTKIADKL